jgi:hypothetical protein
MPTGNDWGYMGGRGERERDGGEGVKGEGNFLLMLRPPAFLDVFLVLFFR